MIKGLEAYMLLLDDVEQCIQSGGCHFVNYKYKEIVVKYLKAFDIIKEKRVNVDNFLRHIKKDTDYKEYKRLCGLYKIMVFSDEELIEEEYDLLRETLL